MHTIDKPDILERTRMCLSEVGIDPSAAFLGPNGRVQVRVYSNMDNKMLWKAVNIASYYDDDYAFRCFACYVAVPTMNPGTPLYDRCQAPVRLMEDCGIDR